MQNCFLKILTETNGEESILYKKAEVEFFDGYAKVVYEEENARVLLELQGKSVRVERVGDYSLSLYLKEGEETISYIGLGGSKGEIASKTDISPNRGITQRERQVFSSLFLLI